MKTAIFVLGMHRSGTSALTGLLKKTGISVGHSLLGPSRDNPKGYFENAKILKFNDDVLLPYLFSTWDNVRIYDSEWLESPEIRLLVDRALQIIQEEYGNEKVFCIKDPRNCVLLPFWTEVMRKYGATSKTILIYRPPMEVAQSLKKRDGFVYEKSLLLWLHYLLFGEFFSRGMQRVFISYKCLLNEPMQLLKMIINKLELHQVNVDVHIGKFIDKSLWHHKREIFTIDVPDFISQANVCFLKTLETGKVDHESKRILDHCRNKFTLLSHFFYVSYVEEKKNHRDESRSDVFLSNDSPPKTCDKQNVKEPSNKARPKTCDKQNIREQYRKKFHTLYKRKHSFYRNQLLWGKEAESWSVFPIISMYLLIQKYDIHSLADTIDSLAEQIYGNWKLTVISHQKCISPIFHEHDELSWIHTEDNEWETANKLIRKDNGDWLLFLKSGDQLSPHCLASLVSIENRMPHKNFIYFDHEIQEEGKNLEYIFKPDLNMDMLRSQDYIQGCFFVKKDTFLNAGGFDPKLKFAELYDLVLKIVDRASFDNIYHISDSLISKSSISYTFDEEKNLLETASKVAIQSHLNRNNLNARVVDGDIPGTFRCLYGYDDFSLVSIIIPTRNQADLLKKCIESLFEKTLYKNYELIIVDNNSDEPDAVDYLEFLKTKPNIQILKYDKLFNYSEANNLASRVASGKYLLFLNNDIEIIQENWLDIMVSYCQREDVGAVGVRLLFPDGKIQHAGVGVGLFGVADHFFIGASPDETGYMNRLQVHQNYSAVTAACMMVKREAFDEVGGFDKDNYQLNFSDVDLCLKLVQAGYKNLWTPYATLVHHTHATQRADCQDPQRAASAQDQFERDKGAFVAKWFPFLCHDPAYNYNLSLGSRHFDLDAEENPCWPPAIFTLPRIWAFPRAKDGAGEYRLRRPLETIEKQGLALTHVGEIMLIPNSLEKHRPNTIVFQTPTSDEAINYLKLIRKYHDGLVIFEIDDLLHHVPFKNPAFQNLKGKNIKARIKEAMKFCDRVVVTTKPLADAYAGFCKDIRIVPNYISKAVWGNLTSKKRKNGKPRVGWAGGAFHYGDLMVIKDVVKELAKEIDWIFMGMCPDEIRPYVAEYHEGVDIDEYPAKLASLDLDLAIAPLEINAFNRAKSNLRILEYGILGWPVVATDIYPYQNAPVTLVKNKYKNWLKAIRNKIADREALIKEGKILQEWVLKNWILENHLNQILEAYV